MGLLTILKESIVFVSMSLQASSHIQSCATTATHRPGSHYRLSSAKLRLNSDSDRSAPMCWC